MSDKSNKDKKSKENTVSYSKLYSLASPRDKLYMVIGHSAAAITGAGLPSFVFLMGEIIDSFNGSEDEMLDAIKKMCVIMVIIGVVIWFFSLIYYTFLLLFS
jgi:hypothetical protein